MKKCLNLAKLGLGKTKTNPLVGCIIVHKNRIISEGYHKKHGEPHAEVNAIQKVTEKTILRECTLYVSLEPCSHYGKTPPCVNLIIKYKIKNIVIGAMDPFKKVNGNSIAKLKKHANVITGIMQSECIKLNRKYFINHSLKRPLLILKWAKSKNGFINNMKMGITRISCEESLILSHKWRSQVDAIMVGTNTIISDNPQLTTRKVKGKNPIRITIDRNNRLQKKKWNIMNDNADTIILNTTNNKIIQNIKYLNINKKGVDDKKLLRHIMSLLYTEGITSILIEGGRKILQNCIEEGLWDEIRIISAKKNINSGIKEPVINYQIKKSIQIGEDNLSLMYNKETIKSIEQSF